MSRPFPFTAVVGMDDLRLALVLAAVSPAIGGVLIRGEKGTAKSTAVRALAEVLPPVEVVDGCRFSCDPAYPDPSCPDWPHDGAAPAGRPVRLVELPVGATEDRVLGSLHLERALAEGVTVFEPGLLAAANRGLLYVDEVNLLHDHLVDVLLDAAAMGRATVERDGVSVSHPARFVLVGTMNPEEGELRPQLLDRFGLTVDVAASRDPEVRVEVMRTRLGYEADPEGFVSRYAGPQGELAERIAKAQSLLPDVILTDAALRQIAEICAAFDVDGMRADLVMARTAMAHAAWSGRTVVEVDDIRAAARLALPHRSRRNPFDAPGLDEDQLEQILQDTSPPDDDPDDDPSGPDDDPSGPGGGPDDPPEDGPPEDGPPEDGPAQGRSGERSDSRGQSVASTRDPYRARLLTVPSAGAGVAGRRSRALTEAGRVVGDRPRRSGESGRPHLLSTLRVAAPHQVTRGRSGSGLEVRPSDLRLAVREGREGNLVLFCVDASGSMGARQRMTEVKTAVLSLLLDAYQRRDKVGLVTFAGTGATVALPPTGSVETAVRRLDTLPTGGRTPLAEGLLQAAEVIRIAAIRDPRRRPLLVLVTDGRATAGPDAFQRAKYVAARLGVPAVVVDCEPRRGVRLGLSAELAGVMGAEYLDLGEVAAGNLVRAVTERRVA
jgi:magnesium chelatase subunit D